MSVTAVSDSSPINYLVLINSIDLLPRIFDRVYIPAAVAQELTCADTPLAVSAFVKEPPAWLFVHPSPARGSHHGLDDGEAEAVQLALDLGISSLLIDERIGYRVAASLGLTPLGVLGILEYSAKQGWISFADVVARLRHRTFRVSEKVIADARLRLKF